ncbi:MAG: hypothetical protein ABI680_03350 [Chthoniobacteraceae bacterium]
MIAITILASLFALGVIIMMVAMVRAPRGYEDENGFHFDHSADREVEGSREHGFEGLHTGRFGRAHL